MGTNVTIHDVAAAAGVSTATVSRALTGKGRISDETTARIRDIAHGLGYQVNSVGKALREGQTRSVGIIVPVIANPFYSSLVRAIEEQLQNVDFELVIADSHGDVEREARRLRLLRGQQVQGIMLVAADSVRSAVAAEETARKLPLICVDRRIEGIDADFVGIDNARGIELILAHLKDRGVRSVALASSDNVTSVGQERQRAFSSYARELGFRVLPPVINAFDIDTGLLAGRMFGVHDELPEAIVAGDDLIALGVVSALGSRGIKVPDDVLVTGFDGTFLATLVDPALTTVEQPVDEIAAVAVEAFRRRQAAIRPIAPIDRQLAPSLRVRGSTGRG